MVGRIAKIRVDIDEMRAGRFELRTSRARPERHSMTLIETLEHRTSVLRARDVAALFQVTPAHLQDGNQGHYSLLVAGAIRFDPKVLAIWLRRRMPVVGPEGSNLLERSA